jgi:signal transduction histidine kinase
MLKLVHKLTLVLFLGITAVLAVNGFFRVRREVAAFRADRVREHRRLCVALGAAFATVWQKEGPESAMEMLAHANVPGDDLLIRWVASSPDRIEAAPVEAVTVNEDDGHGRSIRHTMLPIKLSPTEMGFLDLSEPLLGERRQVTAILADSARTTTVLVLVMAMLSAFAGAWLVGRPMQELAAKARRVGQGDFSGPLGFRRRDEVGVLAREMDAMCAQLVEAHARTAAETSARIAALEQLRRGDRLMTVGQLASGVAHELGTPLNVIGIRADMIAEEDTTIAEARESARIVGRASEQMAQIIRQLLDFARPRGPERAETDLYAVVQRTVTLLSPIAGKKGLSLTLEEGTRSAVAMVDSGQIEQVCANVIVNAIHATSAGGRIDLHVDAERAAPPEGGAQVDAVCIRVRDDGAGIDPEHLPHIFEPFFTTKDVGQGTGLGLSVAYGIVREHGGWMTVDSTPGKGTEFAIHVPRGMAA